VLCFDCVQTSKSLVFFTANGKTNAKYHLPGNPLKHMIRHIIVSVRM